MSEASQAFEHARIHQRLGHEREAEQWYDQAAGYLREQYHWAQHLGVSAFPNGINLGCDRCKQTRMVTSVAGAMDFRDEHAHCGEKQCSAWTCSVCHSDVFAWQDTCPLCGGTMADPEGYKAVPPSAVLRHEQLYWVRVRAETVATVWCRSLLRARRAARAMYPGEGARVSNDCGDWEADTEER